MSTAPTRPATRLAKLISSIPQAIYHPSTGYVVLVFSLALTGLAWYFSLQYSTQRASDKFESQVAEIELAVQKRMNEYARLLQSGVALYNASESVNRDEWNAFITSIDLSGNYPGTQGVGVSILIQPENLQDHVASIRAQGYLEYTVRPAGKRDLYTSIVFLEPFDWRNQRAFGFDMYSEPSRRSAMDRAIATGKPSISPRVTLVQETSKNVQAGLLMYLPIFSEPLPESASIADRKKKLIGFVYAVLRGSDLMQNILLNVGNDVSLLIYDGEIAPESLLYQSKNAADPSQTFGLTASHSLEMYGQQWSFLVKQRLGDDSIGEYWQSTLVGIFGLLIDFLLFYTIHLIGKQRRATDNKEYTRKLKAANKQLTFLNEDLAHANTALTTSNAALEKSNIDLSSFAYSASHDLKSPLRAICNLAGFVKDDSADSLSEKSMGYLSKLQARAERLTRLLDDMMAYAQQGSEVADVSAIDVNESCEDIQKILDFPPGFTFIKNVEIPGVIYGTRQPFHQVLMNLVSNSIKHHDRADGNIEVWARLRNDRIECIVSDDGPGISEEHRERVFRMFSTLQSRDVREGSGVGLALVKKLVENNGGEIEVVASRQWQRGAGVRFSWLIEPGGSTKSVVGNLSEQEKVSAQALAQA